jgi:DNA-binding MarR family transcriptional regulator
MVMARSGRAPNRRFIYLLNLAQRRVQQWSLDDRRGVTSSQSGVLFLLGAKDGALIGDIAKALGVGPSGISGLVDRMEAAGLVRRAPHPEDGRAVRLELTEQGWVARDAAKARAAAINARLVEGFTEQELDVVARWLTHVGDRFRKGNDE